MSDRKYRYIAVDWSGANPAKGIAVAVLESNSRAPKLLPPPSGKNHWTRAEIMMLLEEEAGNPTPTIAGIDYAFAFPCVDCGRYVCNFKSATVSDFWKYVTSFCDESLYAGRFIEDEKHKGQFWETWKGQSKPENMKVRYRETEFAAMIYGANPESVFRLSPNAQVGKGSLSGMALLHQLMRSKGKKHKIAVWPFDRSARKSNGAGKRADLTLVEIYPAIFLLKATGKTGKIKVGKKIGKKKMAHDEAMQELNNALEKFDCEPAKNVCNPLTDHASDALISVAGMAHIAEGEGRAGNIWNPLEGMEPEMSNKILETEGWIFGVPWPERGTGP